MTNNAMIDIDGLVKTFGPFTAVNKISFSVAKGEVLGFLGPNGAGKSTTMKMITGFLTPSAGKVRVAGHDIVSDTIAAQSVIGYLPEGAPAYPEMTPRQFLKFIADARNLKGDAAERAVARAVEQTELGGVLDQSIDTLSKGFKRRVGLAQAILHDPPVLIMDEPTDGLDPNQKHHVRGLIQKMAAEKAIIISTHILEEVEAVCTRAMIIDRGRIVADGTPEELVARSRYHNAVSLVLLDAPGSARSALEALDGVEAVEQTVHGSATHYTLFSTRRGETDVSLIDAVAALGRRENWNVRSLYSEPGRLDEVFRNLTSASDAQVGAIKGAA